MELATRVPLMIRAPWLTDGQTQHLLDRMRGEKFGQNVSGTHNNASATAADRVIRSHTFVELVDIYPTQVRLRTLATHP
jgi:hypothetical protein